MKDSVSRCSRCGARIFDGELVGVEEGRVLCCLCLDLNTARLEIARHVEGDTGTNSENEGPSTNKLTPPPRNG